MTLKPTYRFQFTDGREPSVDLQLSWVEHSGLLSRLVVSFDRLNSTPAPPPPAAGQPPVQIVHMIPDKLDSRRITSRAWKDVVLWIRDSRVVDPTEVSHLLECIVAFSYLEIHELFEHFRNTVVTALETSQTPREARAQLGFPSDALDLVLSPDEFFFLDAWVPVHLRPVRRSPSSPPVPVPECADDSSSSSSAVPLDPDPLMFKSELRGLAKGLPKPSTSSERDASGIPLDIAERRRRVHTDDGSCFHPSCKSAFSWTVRKHHCRACGHSFCSVHCRQTAVIPFQPIGRSKSVYSLVMTGWSDRHLVCDDCFKCLACIEEKVELWSTALAAAALPVHLARKAAALSPEWHAAAMQYLTHFRTLQHRLPSQPFTDTERQMIWSNRRLFAGHSMWLLQLLRVTDWDDSRKRQEAEALLLKPRDVPCSDTLCTRACSGGGLRPIDAVVALNGRHVKLPATVRLHCVCLLDTADSDEILCYIPQLVHYLRYEPIITRVPGKDDQEAKHCPLAGMILWRALAPGPSAARFCMEVYWCLVVAAASGSANEGRYQVMRNLLLTELARRGDAVLSSALTYGHALVSSIKRIDQRSAFAEDVKRLASTGSLFLPYDPSLRIESVDLAKVKVMQSSKRPVKVPCVCTSVPRDGQLPPLTASRDVLPPSPPAACGSPVTKAFLYKEEDLRSDQVVMKCIRLMHVILRKCAAPLNMMPIVTYNVVPSSPGAGFIEMVEGDTITSINDSGTSILEWIAENNPEELAKTITKNFLTSVAAWTVIVYLLGIGDRHLDNLMVTKDGKLINIDFGFILGADPMHLATLARIPLEIINNRKDVFMNWCRSAFLELRRYSVHFYTLLSFLFEYGEPDARQQQQLVNLNQHIAAKFMLGSSDEDALASLDNFIVASFESRASTLRDTAHAGAKTAAWVVERVKSSIRWALSFGSPTTPPTSPAPLASSFSPTPQPPPPQVIQLQPALGSSAGTSASQASSSSGSPTSSTVELRPGPEPGPEAEAEVEAEAEAEVEVSLTVQKPN